MALASSTAIETILLRCNIAASTIRSWKADVCLRTQADTVNRERIAAFLRCGKGRRKRGTRMSESTAKLEFNGKTHELQVRAGSVGPEVIDIAALYKDTGAFTYDPGFTSTASLRIRNHFHRWRRGHFAASRLPDRSAGRAQRFSRSLLPVALWRTADQGAERRFRLPRHAPYHGARADVALFHRVSAAMRTLWR